MIPNKTNGRVVSLNGLANSPANFMSNKSIIAAWLFGVLFVASAAGLVVQFRQLSAAKLVAYNLQEEKKLSQTKREINTDEDLLARLQQIMVLPMDRPTIATVKDLEKMIERTAFLKNAVNGDKMLMFRDRAILFRPSEDKIINMVGSGAMSDLPSTMSSSTATSTAVDLTAVGDTTATTASTELKTDAVKTLEVRNGTATSGLAKQWQSKMVAKGYKVLTIGNAGSDTYAETTLINLSGKDITKLEQELGLAAVTNLPTGEASS